MGSCCTTLAGLELAVFLLQSSEQRGPQVCQHTLYELIKTKEPGMMSHACNPSTWEAREGGLL